MSFPPAVTHTLAGTHDPDGPHDPPIHLSVHELGDGADRPAVVFAAMAFPTSPTPGDTSCPSWPMRGSGDRSRPARLRGSSAPAEISAYGLGQLCGDLADLLDVLEVDRAVFVGHDWGGFVAWAMPALHPDRVAGVAGICTPTHRSRARTSCGPCSATTRRCTCCGSRNPASPRR
ncbi:MAG: alpha/beta fold hydrolase [Microthrixaceae bacterium]